MDWQQQKEQISSSLKHQRLKYQKRSHNLSSNLQASLPSSRRIRLRSARVISRVLATSLGITGCFAVAAIAQPTRLPTGDPQQVPTARYGRGESVDLSLIVEEWRDRYPAIPIYACNCDDDSCGDDSVWPFREFSRYQSFVALGATNASDSEETGFNCFDMETGERP